MAVQVFVSHTQKDMEFSGIFDRGCTQVGLKVFNSEFERLGFSAWETTKKAIRASRVLFLLVGEGLVKASMSGEPSWAYTQNWIGYEIGIAYERGMDVWVICDDVQINFPVPYFNNYLPKSLREKETSDFLLAILRIYTRRRKLRFPDSQYGLSCPYEDCQIPFNLWMPAKPNDVIICPHCLQEIGFDKRFPAA